jgi:hypothetical protein
MILSWDKPPKLRKEGWPYEPNISRANREKWKAKFVGAKRGGKRIEIRKSIRGTQILLVVTAAEVTMSMNGKAVFAGEQMDQLHQAVQEARKVLENV